MNKIEVVSEIRAAAKSNGIDPDLVCAIAQKESYFRTDAVRFEPDYRWTFEVQSHALICGISMETEKALQRFSVGPLQVMSAVCREYGYDGTLALLPSLPMLTIAYGVQHLVMLAKKYHLESDLIAAYNAGSPVRIPSGEYRNQKYVDGVLAALQKFRIGPSAG